MQLHVPANFRLGVIVILEVDALAHCHVSVGKARLDLCENFVQKSGFNRSRVVMMINGLCVA